MCICKEAMLSGSKKIIYLNHTDSHNLNAVARRWRKGEKEECFKRCLTLDGNPGWDFETYEVGMMVFEYAVAWMDRNGYPDVAKYLNGRRGDIAAEFMKAAKYMVDEKLKEIDEIKRRLLPLRPK